jgi:3-methyladenine DNA glycosylase AlkD
MPAKEYVDAATALAWLRKTGTKKVVAGMTRYGIPSANAVGVTVGDLKKYAKTIGKDHALAEGLWKSGMYEARMLAAFVDDAEQVTGTQMDRWARDFDSWAITDTVCFALFDRAADRWKKVHAWAPAKAEFKKRGAFALLWGMTVHDREADDDAFLASLPLIEAGARDTRDYVKKGVDMALRAVGKRSAGLRKAAVGLAKRMAKSTDGAQAWVARHALRELT